VVTSSAVVGSSAISSFGRQISAMAMQTRWRARELEGEALQRRFRIGEAYPGEHGGGFCFGGPLVKGAVEQQRFGDLVADGVDGAERRHRLLEHHAEIAAPDVAHGPADGVELGEVEFAADLGGIADGTIDDASGALDDAHDRAGHDRLPRTRLADDAEDTAARHVEIDPVDGFHQALVGLEMGLEVADFDEVVRALHGLPQLE